MTASDKIFAILDLPEEENKNATPENNSIKLENLTFGYTKEQEILHGINMEFNEGSFTAIVGESGCGKSTVAGILTSRNKGYAGSVQLGNAQLNQVSEETLMRRITLISHNSYIFKGSLEDNLLMGKPDATKEELLKVLEKVNLLEFVQASGGLEMPLLEAGANLSGGQRQRLALARALLHNSPVYIFDEATSNIDVESENDIMKLIMEMTEGADRKTVILISHRLANVVKADNIYVMEAGNIVEAGNHQALLSGNGLYKKLWDEQFALENMLKEGE